MPHYVDWSDPYFPRIRDTPEGDSLGTVFLVVLRHHKEIIESHIRAIERLIDDISNQTR